MKIVFATGNRNKVKEAEEILGKGFELVTPVEAGIDEDIPETANSFRGNSLQKAKYIYEKTGLNCFADDSGLEVEILGGAPGVHTARYAGESRDSDANMDKLLLEMARREGEATAMRGLGISTPHATRRARFRTSVTLILGGETFFFDGTMEGTISLEKRGAHGFGYDPVFLPLEAGGRTSAELSDEEKNAISHRGKAMRAMAEFLRSKIEGK